MTSIIRQYLPPASRRACSLLFILAVVFTVPAFAQKKTADELQIEKCWEYRYAGNADARLASDGATVFIVRDGSFVEAVSADSGKLLWSSDVGGSVDSNLLVAGSSVILVRRTVASGAEKAEKTVLTALSSATGVTKWNASVDAGREFTLGAIGDELIAISQSGAMQGFGLADGVDRWKRQLPSAIVTAPVFAGKMAYFAYDATHINSISNGGEPVSIANASFAISALSQPNEDTLAWGDMRGNLTSFGLASGKISWRFKSGARISEIIRVNGWLVAASNDNFVYAIAPGSGNRVWKKRVPGRIQSIQAVGDDTVLILTAGEHNLLLLRSKNGKPAGQIGFKDDELPIAAAVTGLKSFAALTDKLLYLYGLGSCRSK